MWKLTCKCIPICLVLLSSLDLLLSELPRSFVCGNETYNETDMLSLCCNGKLHPRTNDNGTELGCCADVGKLYVKKTHLCCGPHLLPKYNVLGEERHCCGDGIYLAKEGYCCEGNFQEFGSGNGCCGKKTYRYSDQFCCVNSHGDSLVYQLHNAMRIPECCELQLYDASRSYCDYYTGEILLNTQIRCGTELIDVNTHTCCSGQTWELPDPSAWDKYSCCDVNLVDNRAQKCCSLGGYPEKFRVIPMEMKCCGNDTYNPRTHGCCEDRVVRIPHTRGTNVCCGNRMIDLLNHHCCGKKVLHKHEECCGGLKLSRRNVCCHPKWSRDHSQIIKRKMNDTDCCLHGDKLQLKAPYNKHDQACDIRMGVVKKIIPTLSTSTTTSTKTAEKQRAMEESGDFPVESSGSSHMSFCIYTLAPITILWLLITGYLQI